MEVASASDMQLSLITAQKALHEYIAWHKRDLFHNVVPM